MALIEEVRAIVAAVGPASADIEGVLERGEGDWLLRYPDRDLALELDAESRRLVLSAELGEPRPEARLQVLTTLLTYALLWRETGGVYVALNAAETPVLLLPLWAEELTAERLSAVIGNFLEKARTLDTYVARGGQEPGASDTWAPQDGIRI